MAATSREPALRTGTPSQTAKGRGPEHEALGAALAPHPAGEARVTQAAVMVPSLMTKSRRVNFAVSSEGWRSE